MGKRLIPPEPSDVQEIALREALEERYLAYALSTIMHRALPDARDGLKPVHRRILYGMRLLRLDPGAAFKKSRQDRRRRDGQIPSARRPGDLRRAGAARAGFRVSAIRWSTGRAISAISTAITPPPMRYTEARLTEVARLLLDGIDEDAVDFRPTYDGQPSEPVVLPGAFPNLLANGSQGIAVGMATSIPPHNAAELCDAALFLIDNPNARAKTLLKYVQGPDFPTGGIIVDPPRAIAEAYATGRGSFRVRARWNKEETGRGTYQIVVTEIPWLVQKTRLIEQIAELLNEKKLPLVADFRDEFDRGRAHRHRAEVAHGRCRAADGVAVQADRAREPHPAQHERARPRAGCPRCMGLAEVLQRVARPPPRGAGPPLQAPARRRSSTASRCWAASSIAYLNLDKVIKIIRNEDEPKPVLMKTFKLTDVQADAILNMRLRNLRKLEEMEIRRENKELREEKAGDREAARAPRRSSGRRSPTRSRRCARRSARRPPLGKRRTDFAEAPEHDEAAIEEAMVVREPITVVVSEKGWIRALRGHVRPICRASRSRPTTG